jgi:hypothetical protein
MMRPGIGGRAWRVLVPLDGSRAAHRAVRSLVNRAKREGPMEVVLVGLAPLATRILPALFASLLFAPGESPIERLRDASALLAMHGISHRVVAAAGGAERVIDVAVRSHGADEVVIGPIGGVAAGRSLAYRLATRLGTRVTFVA